MARSQSDLVFPRPDNKMYSPGAKSSGWMATGCVLSFRLFRRPMDPVSVTHAGVHAGGSSRRRTRPQSAQTSESHAGETPDGSSGPAREGIHGLTFTRPPAALTRVNYFRVCSMVSPTYGETMVGRTGLHL